MTYINLDSNFVELRALSKLMSVPEYQIVDVVDKGILGFDEETVETSRTLLDLIRFASFLFNVEIEENVKSDLIKAYADGMSVTKSLEKLFVEEKINRDQLITLLSWEST